MYLAKTVGPKIYFNKFWDTYKIIFVTHCWNWNDFFYNLLLDLAPAAWDIITDLLFAKALETVHATSAALSYLSICLPALYLVALLVAKQKTGIKILAFLILLSTGLWAWVLLKVTSNLFRAPAFLFSTMFLAVKVLAVFVHTPEMARLSLQMTRVENVTESRMQLLLILHTWMSGGLFHWDTLVSTFLDIGKVAAESFLAAQPNDLLKGKPFFDRLVLVLKYLPVFVLTAVFRHCSEAVKLMNYSAGFFFPFSAGFFIILAWAYVVIEHWVYQLWYSVLGIHLMPSLKRLDFWERISVLASESTTISVWGCLRHCSRVARQ